MRFLLRAAGTRTRVIGLAKPALDRNAPDVCGHTAQSAYDDSRALFAEMAMAWSAVLVTHQPFSRHLRPESLTPLGALWPSSSMPEQTPSQPSRSTKSQWVRDLTRRTREYLDTYRGRNGLLGQTACMVMRSI